MKKNFTFEDKKKLVKEYEKKGWIVIRKVLNPIQVKKNKKILLNFLKKNHKKFDGRDVNYFNNNKSFRNISSFHNLQTSRHIKKMSQKGIFYKLAKLFLLNKTPELRASEMFVKRCNSGSFTPIHQDAYYWNVKGDKGLTIWIALSKSDKKNGSVFYYDKSHKAGVMPHKASYIKGSSQKIKNIKNLRKFTKVSPKLSMGDILIHNSLTVHGSYKNKSNKDRMGWTFAYKPKSSPYDLLRTKKYEKILYSQILKRSNGS